MVKVFILVSIFCVFWGISLGMESSAKQYADIEDEVCRNCGGLKGKMFRMRIIDLVKESSGFFDQTNGMKCHCSFSTSTAVSSVKGGKRGKEKSPSKTFNIDGGVEETKTKESSKVPAKAQKTNALKETFYDIDGYLMSEKHLPLASKKISNDKQPDSKANIPMIKKDIIIGKFIPESDTPAKQKPQKKKEPERNYDYLFGMNNFLYAGRRGEKE